MVSTSKVAQTRSLSRQSYRPKIRWLKSATIGVLLAPIVIGLPAAYVERQAIIGYDPMNRQEGITSPSGDGPAAQRLVAVLTDLQRKDEFGPGGNGSTAVHAVNTFRQLESDLAGRDPNGNPESPLAGKSLLEIGCGETLAHGVLAVLFGAKDYACIEIGTSPHRRAPESYEAAVALAKIMVVRRGQVPQRQPEEIFWKEGDKVVFDEKLVKLFEMPDQNYRLTDLFDPGSFDVIFTNSVLEHLAAPEPMISDMCAMLKPGGFMVHSLNMADHSRNDPYRFLGTEPAPINADDASGHHENRRRLHQYLEAVSASGFRILSLRTNLDVPNLFEGTGWSWHMVGDEERRQFVEPWRSMTNEQLSAVVAWFVAEKVGDCGQ